MAAAICGGRHSADDIEDVVQGFFAKPFFAVLRRWDPGLGRFDSYFGTAFRRHCKRAAKGRWRLESMEVRSADGPGKAPEATVEAIEYDGVGALLHKCLEGLPAGYRDVVLRLYFVGQTHEEIAAALGITRENSRVRLHRALKKLRDCLGGVEERAV